jgi:nitroreductase
MTREQFWRDYQEHLARAMREQPDQYMLLDAAIVAARMRAAVENKGIGGIIINTSRAWNRMARQVGIKNTYKAWAPFLATLTD